MAFPPERVGFFLGGIDPLDVSSLGVRIEKCRGLEIRGRCPKDTLDDWQIAAYVEDATASFWPSRSEALNHQSGSGRAAETNTVALKIGAAV